MAPLTRSVPLSHDEESSEPRLQRNPIAQPEELARDERESHLLDEFFSWPPPAVDYTPVPFEPAPMSRVSRGAMWATLFMLCVGFLGLGGFVAYRNFIMPAPAELSDADATQSFDLPTPSPEDQQLAAAEAPRSDLRARLATREVLQREAEETAAAFLADDEETEAAQETSVSAATDPQPKTAPSGTELAANDRPATYAPPPTAAAPAGSAKPAAAAAPSTSPQPTAATAKAAPATDDAQSFDELVAQARKLSDQGDAKQALLTYDRALAPRPHAIEALLGKAAALFALRDYDAAKSTAEQAVALDPSNRDGLLLIGSTWEQLGNKAAAKDTYQRCVDETKDNGAPCRTRLDQLNAKP